MEATIHMTLEQQLKKASRNFYYQNPRWKKKKPPYVIGMDGFTYRDAIKDEDGWVDASKFLPMPYELVRVKTQDKSKNLWWNGREWEGFRKKDEDKVFYWKAGNECMIYAA